MAKYSDDELQFLKNNYSNLPLKEISHYLGRSMAAIHSKAAQLDLRQKYNCHPATEDEKQTNRSGFAPGDSIDSIALKLHRYQS